MKKAKGSKVQKTNAAEKKPVQKPLAKGASFGLKYLYSIRFCVALNEPFLQEIT